MTMSTTKLVEMSMSSLYIYEREYEYEYEYGGLTLIECFDFYI